MSAPDDLVAFCEVQRPRLVGMLGLHCGDPDVAEELAQDAIAKACEKWTKVREMEFPEAWISKVALNLATSYFRRRAAESRAKKRIQGQSHETLSAPSTAWAVEVRKAVASLPPRQRSALVLRYYLDMSIIETAQLMDCSEGTVKALTHKASRTLQRHPSFAGAKEVADA